MTFVTNNNQQTILSGVWNSSSTFTAFEVDVLDTSSNINSLIFDTQVNGSSKFKIRKDGQTTITSALITNLSAATYSNLPVNQRIIPITILNPSSITYYPLFYAKYMANIEEVNSVLVGGTSVTWSVWLASDVSDPTTGTQLYDSKITNSLTTGNTETGVSISEGWVVLEVVGYSGSVGQLQLTFITD